MKIEIDYESQQPRYFHVIPIKNISVSAQSYNARQVTDEFWEDFHNIPYFSPIAYASCISDYKIFSAVMTIFQKLDHNNMKYSSMNTAADFAKRHIITDGSSEVSLCNKHLIKASKRGLKPQYFYTRNSWIKAMLKLVFPKIDDTKDGIPTNTPHWAISLYRSARAEPKSKNKNNELGDA